MPGDCWDALPFPLSSQACALSAIVCVGFRGGLCVVKGALVGLRTVGLFRLRVTVSHSPSPLSVPDAFLGLWGAESEESLSLLDDPSLPTRIVGFLPFSGGGGEILLSSISRVGFRSWLRFPCSLAVLRKVICGHAYPTPYWQVTVVDCDNCLLLCRMIGDSKLSSPALSCL